MSEKRLAFIHVNYNNSQLTINCIESILENSLDSDILVIDNNSRENEKKILKEWVLSTKNEKIKLIFEESNLGYFRALNSGLKLVLKDSNQYSYVIIGNNDLIFNTDFFENLHTNNYDDDTMVISPNIIKTNGIHQNPFSIKRTSRIRKILYRLLYLDYKLAKIIYFTANKLGVMKSENNKIGFEKSQFIFAGHGACYILTTKFLNRDEILVESSFLMGEEFLLAKQIRDANGKIYYDANLKVIHNEHSSMSAIPSETKYRFEQQAYKLFKNIC